MKKENPGDEDFNPHQTFDTGDGWPGTKNEWEQVFVYDLLRPSGYRSQHLLLVLLHSLFFFIIIIKVT